MPGYVHIFRLGAEPAPHGRTVPQYQLNYNLGGNTYVRVFDEEGLSEFLHSDVGLIPEVANRAVEELRHLGNTTIADVGIEEYKAAGLGLQQLPSDY